MICGIRFVNEESGVDVDVDADVAVDVDVDGTSLAAFVPSLLDVVVGVEAFDDSGSSSETSSRSASSAPSNRIFFLDVVVVVVVVVAVDDSFSVGFDGVESGTSPAGSSSLVSIDIVG
jgi:hypothetical protein